jgi:hypothetical protein
VRRRPNIFFDGVFYSLYTYFLLRFFRLTPQMVYQNAKYWLKYQLMSKAKNSS